MAEAARRIAHCRESNAEELDLSGLMLGEIPEDIASLTTVRTLNLSGNPLGLSGLLGRGPIDGGMAHLAGLTALQSLDLSATSIGDEGMAHLAGLTGLEKLNLSNNRIFASGAAHLARLARLQRLDLAGNTLRAAGAAHLASLTALQFLDLAHNQIGDDGVAHLANLTKLTYLDLSEKDDPFELWAHYIHAGGAAHLSGLTALTYLSLAHHDIGAVGATHLAGLTELTNLDLSGNELGDVGAKHLAGLIALTHLNLSSNEIGAIGTAHLAGLTALTDLDLSGNKLGAVGATHLASLTALTRLNLSGNEIGTVGTAHLAALTGLTNLDLSNCGEVDLIHLVGLPHLTELDLSGCHALDPCPKLWAGSHLRRVFFEPGRFPGVPAELLSTNGSFNCLPRLRAYFDGLEAGRVPLTDVKVMLLGNGRVGKTKIARRLCGEPYGADDECSTHGVQVKRPREPLAMPTPAPEARLKIWDFGGQDIYHGTHALFLKTRAVFPIVWTPASEAAREHEHAGFTFRNQPLGYWLAYVRQMSGEGSPALVVQAQADTREDEADVGDFVADDALEGFARKPEVLAYSAKTNRRRGTLDDALVDAVTALRSRDGEVFIPTSWNWVKDGLEGMFQQDQAKPAAERQHRLYSKAAFADLCQSAREQFGPVDNAVVLQYLHDTGTVFYREDRFGDQIILDQQWALDAVYAVFDRTQGSSYQEISERLGRFTQSQLVRWVWGKFAPAEQDLFLTFMRTCDICFVHRRGDAARGIETEYIAPELLPKRDHPDVARLLARNWQGAADVTLTLTYELLPASLVRAIIARIGQEAGLDGEYWQTGVLIFESRTQSRALIEAEIADPGWSGRLTIRTQAGDAHGLADTLLQRIRRIERDIGIAGVLDGGAESQERSEPTVRLSTTRDPAPQPSVNLSYTHADKVIRDELDLRAQHHGVLLRYDERDMQREERITQFMDRLTKGDRVVALMSALYLKKPYCVRELVKTWIYSRQDPAEFCGRIRVLVRPDAAIDAAGRNTLYAYWKGEIDRIAASAPPAGLGSATSDELYELRQWLVHLDRILHVIADIIMPREIEAFAKAAFADLAPGRGKGT